MKLQTPAYINSIRSLADKTLRLTVDCQELPPEQSSLLFSLLQKYGYFLFKETEFNEEDLLNIPEIQTEFRNDKSPSQRLRNILYRVWEAKFKSQFTDFETFYKWEMNKIGEHFINAYLET